MIGILNKISVTIEQCSLDWMSPHLGTYHRTRVPAAISQHIHIELTLADVTSGAIQALQQNQHKNLFSNSEARDT